MVTTLLAALLLSASPPEEAPVLATPPSLKALVPAEIPPGTPFPAPEVAVVLALDVSAEGRVEGARIEEGAGPPFDEAALAAARRFEFEPGRLATGEPVPVTVSFRLRIAAPPPPEPAAPQPPPVRMGGRLLERGTRRPLASVPVAARSGGETIARATTDAAGGFALEVPASSFSLAAAPPGHERLDVRIDAVPGESREEVYYLESTGTGSETVVRSTSVEREVTKRVLPAEEVERVAGTQGDALKAVLNLPGAARAPFGSGTLILRGSSPGDSRVFLEGQEIPLLTHFGGLRSTFASRFLESVEFVPGNFSARYGRATGGIVEVRVRDPAGDLFRGEAGANLYDAGFALEGPLGRGWSGGAAFRRSWIDALLPLVVPDDADVSFDVAPRYYDYQLVTARPFPGGGRFRAFFYGSMDRFELVLDEPASDPKISGSLRGRIMFHALQAELETPLSPRLRQATSLQLYLQDLRTAFGPEFFFDLSVRGGSLRSAWTFDPAPTLSVRAGLDVSLGHAEVGVNAPEAPLEGEPAPPTSSVPVVGVALSTTLYQPAAFAELRWQAARGLTVVPGLRVDWYRDLEAWSVAPRLAVFWEAWPGTTLEAGAGLYEQPPAPQESAPGVGNPDLEPERALHVSAGVRRRLGESLDAHLTAFAKRLDRLVVRNPAAAWDPGAVPYLSEGEGRIYGLEVLLQARLGDRLSGWLAYTFQRSLREDGFGAPERPFDFDQPHLLTAVASWRFARAWSAGARIRYASGNPDTPVAGSVYDAGAGTYVPLYGAVNSERLPGFFQLDLRVDRIWTFPTWRLSLYLDVQNATNRGNAEGWTYDADYSRRRALTGLPVLPILGLEGEW
ncbi:MAG TPA: TonB-dependent receptor [Anaeromyxobacteraceae bacterium]|nr:TonB-dependent receptor [Anaeromyxobacteraceae bacterium]